MSTHRVCAVEHILPTCASSCALTPALLRPIAFAAPRPRYTLTVYGRTLLIPAKPDVERDAVAHAFEHRGGGVQRLDRFWEVAPTPGAVVYGPDTFALVVAEQLGVTLVSPADDLLARAPADALRRDVTLASLDHALCGPWPRFVKPVVPKQFRAGVWADAASLAHETRGLPSDTAVLCSEVVHFANEVRAFILDRSVRTAACYEGEGDVDAATRALIAMLPSLELPTACVLDIGYIEGRGWALIEANAAWGAGLNGCDATRAVEVIARATLS